MPFFQGAHAFVITDDNSSPGRRRRGGMGSTPMPFTAQSSNVAVGPNQVSGIENSLAVLAASQNAMITSDQGTYIDYQSGSVSMSGLIKPMSQEEMEDLEAELAEIPEALDKMRKRKEEKRARKAEEAARVGGGRAGQGRLGGSQQLLSGPPPGVTVMPNMFLSAVNTAPMYANTGPDPNLIEYAGFGGGMSHGNAYGYPPQGQPGTWAAPYSPQGYPGMEHYSSQGYYGHYPPYDAGFGQAGPPGASNPLDQQKERDGEHQESLATRAQYESVRSST